MLYNSQIKVKERGKYRYYNFFTQSHLSYRVRIIPSYLHPINPPILSALTEITMSIG